MRTYRIVTRDGVELMTLEVPNLVEAITSSAATTAPLGALVTSADGSRVLARKELWTGGSPGWSLWTGA